MQRELLIRSLALYLAAKRLLAWITICSRSWFPAATLQEMSLMLARPAGVPTYQMQHGKKKIDAATTRA